MAVSNVLPLQAAINIWADVKGPARALSGMNNHNKVAQEILTTSNASTMTETVTKLQIVGEKLPVLASMLKADGIDSEGKLTNRVAVLTDKLLTQVTVLANEVAQEIRALEAGERKEAVDRALSLNIFDYFGQVEVIEGTLAREVSLNELDETITLYVQGQLDKIVASDDNVRMSALRLANDVVKLAHETTLPLVYELISDAALTRQSEQAEMSDSDTEQAQPSTTTPVAPKATATNVIADNGFMPM